MKDILTIHVFEVVGSGLCVASDDGQKVHDQIAAGIKSGSRVEISFRNVKSLTSAFLNAAVGQLYGKFSDEEIRRKLSATDLETDDIVLLKRVVETAKQYFKNPKRFEKAVHEAMGNR